MNHLIQDVISWAEERNLISGSDHKTQTLKLISEAGKLSKSLNFKEDCRSNVGNCFIRLIVLSAMDEYNIEEFIAQSDLSKIDDTHDSVSSFMYELWQGLGRLSDAVNDKDSYRSIVDDLLIMLSGIARFYNYSLEECLEIAYYHLKV
ncbi:hypothetical protein [Nitrosomonas sp. Nm166]|uniref:hypothetical protein n=1 Tax=Nitrosomonas sp. Nm166 TaxID=1881054 RepID=UPI0008EBEAB2|nr:hypothetical protein [Nitrosomonas sp. Nm166]SFF18523.1 hypothetical protein SAMN05428977_10665 [Nitrosomonas sp. Nm166]